MTTRPAFTSSAAAPGEAAAAEAKAGEGQLRSAPVIPPAPDGFPTLRREAGEHTMSSAIRDFNGPPSQLMVGTCPRDGRACFLSRADAKRAARGMFPGQHHRPVRCGDRWHFVRMGGGSR